ncbi:hypothetical protein MMC17_009128 [Xylographa soralifera]|nr:hypothetical protein [Xylographa soralifera]
MEGSRMIWLQARIRDEPYNPELGATSGSAGRDPILPISLGMVPEDHTVNDLAGLIVKRFDTVHPDKGKLKVRYLQTEYGALMSVLDPVGMHFPRRNGQEPDKPFTILAIRFPPLPEELQNSARFTSVAPESSARPYKRSRDELQQAAASNRHGYINMHNGNVFANKRQRLSNGGREGTFDPDRPIRSRERDLPAMDVKIYRSTRQDASNYIIADSQESPRRTHINTYGTPKSLSTASVNASAIYRPQDPASVPDSPNHRGGSPTARVLQDEHMSQDVPKSESPEQDNIVYSIPPSNPSTPREQTVSRIEEPTATFLKPSLPVAKTKTPIRAFTGGVSSSKKILSADRYRTSEGPRAEFVGKCRPIAQSGLGMLTSATSIASKAFSNRKPPKDIWEFDGSDKEGSCRTDLVHSTKRFKQQRPTVADPLPEPRLFSQFNGSSTRSPSASRGVLDNTGSRRGSTTKLTNIEDLNLNRSMSKISDHALDNVSIIKDIIPRAIYPTLEEAGVEDSRHSEQDNTQPTNSVADSPAESYSNDQQVYKETISERDSDKTVGIIKPNMEHGMDDVEMMLNVEHVQSDAQSPDQALNTENHMGTGTNDQQKAVKNGLKTTIEKPNAGKTLTSAKITKQTQSTMDIAHNISHKETREATAAERKAKKAHKKEIEKKERVRKARELEEQQKIEVSRQNEKRCIGTPAAVRFQQKSITSPIPGPSQRRSALKASTSLRSSSISSHGTPSRSMNIDAQIPIPNAIQPPSVVVSRSVSFADSKEARASGKSTANVRDTSKSMKSKEELAKAPVKPIEPVTTKDKIQVSRERIRDILAETKAKGKETELEKTEYTKLIEVVKAKAGKIKPETRQMELKVIRDKGKKPIYDPPLPPRPIVFHVAKESEVGEGGFSDTPLPYLGSHPGPSKSRFSLTNAPLNDRIGTHEEGPPTFKEAPRIVRTRSAGSISEGVKAAEQLPRDDPLLSKSASRSPAREVISSASDSGSDIQSDSDSGSEDADKDEGQGEVNDGGRNVKPRNQTSTNAMHQTTTVPVPVCAETSSESETDSDDGELPPMKPQSRTKSPSMSDSLTEDEDDYSARQSSSIHGGTASGSASIMDEAERQLQRENRQSMEPSRSSQLYPPQKTPRVAGAPVIAQQAKTTNLLSSGTRLPNQRLHSLSSMMKGASASTVTAGKKLPAYEVPSMKTTVDQIPEASIISLPVTRLGNADSQSSSEDEDDDDDDDTDDVKKGKAGKGFICLMKLAKQMDS